jgi:4-hydroxybenzoate polyprenyltransferase
MNTLTAEKPFPLLSPGFVRAYWITMRPYLLFVSGITGAVGMAFAPPAEALRLVLIFSASFLAYGFGQALTDCFQTDTDSISAPYRPLTQGRVSRHHVLIVSTLGLAGCITVFARHDPWLVVPGLCAGAGLATYTFFKRRWWGGPLYNAWIVDVLCLMSFGAAGGSLFLSPPAGFVWTLGVVLFGYALFVLVGYFKDTRADAATGYHTLPVTFGRRAAAWAGDGLAVLAILCYTGVLLSAPGIPGELSARAVAVLLGTAGAACLVAGQILIHRNREDSTAHTPVSCTVHGYILLLGSITVTQQPAWWDAVLVFYAVFVVVLRMRPVESQI